MVSGSPPIACQQTSIPEPPEQSVRTDVVPPFLSIWWPHVGTGCALHADVVVLPATLAPDTLGHVWQAAERVVNMYCRMEDERLTCIRNYKGDVCRPESSRAMPSLTGTELDAPVIVFTYLRQSSVRLLTFDGCLVTDRRWVDSRARRHTLSPQRVRQNIPK